MKKVVICFAAASFLFFAGIGANAQEKCDGGTSRTLTEIVRNRTTSVKDQHISGTCWCFATVSFLESELLRMGKGEFDLSEMFIVRHNYYDRLNDNYLRRGKGNVGEGSIGHMVLNVVKKYGIVPQKVYSGINYDSELPDHRELGAYLHAIAEASVKLKYRSPEYFELQDALFDIYMGKIPETFQYDGKEYTAESFRDFLGIDADDYVELTSLTHHDFYKRVPLEIPDNWDHALLYNLPLDEFMEVIDNALNKGFTVAWDGDVSEKGYIYQDPYCCIIPADPSIGKERIAAGEKIEEIAEVTPELRQTWFETFATTDDHLEHIVGIAKDDDGTKYYIVKNSWGVSNDLGGYHYFSEKYVMGKTVSIIVHKEALPKDIRKKLNIR